MTNKQKTIEDQIKLFREIFRVWCYDADGFNHINDFKMWIREQLILAERRGYKKAKKEIRSEIIALNQANSKEYLHYDSSLKTYKEEILNIINRVSLTQSENEGKV